MKKVYRKTNPHLFDVAINDIQTALNDECDWLNSIFGRCERLVKEINGQRYFTANWYKKANDYILIAPDEGLGNFCFFVLDEPTDLENYFAGDVTRCNIGFSLIVWCDLRTISTDRGTEGVKEEILNILNGHVHLHSGRMTINKVYERAENVFRGFDYEEIDNQFNMHPFAAFRFEGELMVDTLCMPYVPPTPPVEPQYIRGHITTGANTFTFIIKNQNITVDVDKNGWWQWNVDREITSLYNAFNGYNTIVLDTIELVNIDLSNITSFYCAFAQEGEVTQNYPMRKLDMSRCKGSIKVSPNYIMYRNRTLWYMPNIEVWSGNTIMQGYSRVIATGYIKTNINVSNALYLEMTDVLSLINHAESNVTYTLNPNTYNLCKQGGIWYNNIQAAIDAKAAQGFTVTLISA